MHRVKTVRIAEEIIRRLRRAADPGNLGDAMRLDGEVETGFDDRRGDRVMPAAGAQRRDLALVVAMGIAELILRQARMLEFRFCDVGHDGLPRALPSLPGLTRQSILFGKIL